MHGYIWSTRDPRKSNGLILKQLEYKPNNSRALKVQERNNSIYIISNGKNTSKVEPPPGMNCVFMVICYQTVLDWSVIHVLRTYLFRSIFLWFRNHILPRAHICLRTIWIHHHIDNLVNEFYIRFLSQTKRWIKNNLTEPSTQWVPSCDDVALQIAESGSPQVGWHWLMQSTKWDLFSHGTTVLNV